MAEKMVVWESTFRAGADLRTHQWKPQKMTAANTSGLPTAATDRCIGILQNKPNTGEAAAVLIMGRSPVVSDGSGTAIAVGDLIGPNASGVMVKKATADFNVLGMAVEASTTNGAVISALIFGPGVFRTLAG